MPPQKSSSPNTGKRRGRPKQVPQFIEPITGAAIELPLSKINLDDETYKFRADLRLGKLITSIKEQGQKVPILVRKVGKTRGQYYQIISGFRRVSAIKEIGWGTVSGIVVDDIDDEEAFKVSVLENVARKTYSDIDRAYVIKSYEDRGHTSVQIATLMGLAKRQKNNLRSLLDLPQEVQDAIADDESYFKTTHALLLKRFKGTNEKPGAYPELVFEPWIELVNEEELSVAQLTRRVNAEYKPPEPAGFQSIFNPQGTDEEKRVFRLMPLKLDVGQLSPDERDSVREQLQTLLLALR